MAGKYKCLLCQKEFVSESGVKYHINSVHAEVRVLLSHWFSLLIIFPFPIQCTIAEMDFVSVFVG